MELSDKDVMCQVAILEISFLYVSLLAKMVQIWRQADHEIAIMYIFKVFISLQVLLNNTLVLAIMSLITDAIQALLKLKNQRLKGHRKLNDKYSIVLELYIFKVL